MAYIPNADNPDQPLDTEFAATAASEFRALKKKVNNFFKDSAYNPNENSNHTDRALAIFNLGQSNADNTLYSVLGLTSRAGGTGHVIGGYFSASVLPGVFLSASAACAGITVEASTSSQNSDVTRLIGGNFFATQRNHSGQDRVIGISTTFMNRSASLWNGSVDGGIGDNKYNINAIAFLIQAQIRSTANEHCGWKVGIRFEDFALDSDFNGNLPVAIDFTGLGNCSTTPDPISGYGCVPFHFNSNTLSIHACKNTGAIVAPTHVNGWIPVLVNGFDAYGIPLYELDFSVLGPPAAEMPTPTPIPPVVDPIPKVPKPPFQP